MHIQLWSTVAANRPCGCQATNDFSNRVVTAFRVYGWVNAELVLMASKADNGGFRSPYRGSVLWHQFYRGVQSIGFVPRVEYLVCSSNGEVRYDRGTP